jgi:hypothetical protein
MLNLAWVFQTRCAVSCGFFRIVKFVIGDRRGLFPCMMHLKPVSMESLKVLVLFDDPPRIYAAFLRDVSAWSVGFAIVAGLSSGSGA